MQLRSSLSPSFFTLLHNCYGRFHLLILALCGWAVSSDAIEVLSVSFLLPSATCDFGLSSTDKGNLNSVIFLGMIVGGYFWGSLADKAGRRTVLLGSLTVNGLGGLASSVAQSFWLFLLLRFISGVGVGGSIPVIFSYFTEFQPKAKRGMMISVLATFWMFGNIIAAGLAWAIIPQNLGVVTPSFTYDSWRVFIAVCTIPSLTSAAIFILMPESPKFLIETGKEDMAVAVLRKVHRINKPKEFKVFPYTFVTLSGDEDEKSKRDDVLPRNLNCCARYWIATKQMLTTTVKLFRKPMAGRNYRYSCYQLHFIFRVKYPMEKLQVREEAMKRP
ncbi:synaptic vesicle glycoprotein 2A-like [Liolophura sinensis]|uniref:synaptic vesicle glycoprotein 2A-like n=1 Tax=Liolophura sinensis TaxID=3198878 RepID=UPI0031590FF4